MSVAALTPTSNQSQPQTLTREHALWLGVFAIAALSRLLHLDAAPLNSSEAAASLNALALVRGESASVTNPLFASMQALLFSLFGAHDWLARLIPACAGILFCVVPFTLRRHLGSGRALWLSALLALSPTLWFISRQAEGASLAWALALSCFCAWKANSQTLSGALMGLLLASGQDAVTPLLVVVAARLADRIVAIDWRRFGLAAAVALVLGSTGLLLRPAGLGDVFNGLAAWWQQVVTPGPFMTGRLLMGFAVYEPLIMVTAVIGELMLMLTPSSSRSNLLSRWLRALRSESVSAARIFVGLGLLLIMQGRQPSNLVPIVIGLAGYAAYAANAITHNISAYAQLRREGSLLAISLVLWLFGGLAVRQYAASGETSWLLLCVVAIVFNLALVAFGSVLSEMTIGLRAVACALGTVLVLHTLAAAVQLTHTRPTNPAEAYAIAPAPQELRVLAETVADKSTRAYGEPNVMPLDLAEDAPASVRWALRNRTQLSLRAGNSDSAAALTSEAQRPQGETAFVGSAFPVQRSVNLNAARCNFGAERVGLLGIGALAGVPRGGHTPRRDLDFLAAQRCGGFGEWGSITERI
ncbi:MAG: hypothetical protein HC853_03580 [Anaerolineae bacterium]|nr:hypothetical protein [Anaerolineae bacterium]